jgi:hypothetical protein
VTAFFLSGGYLVAISEVEQFRTTIRQVPSDYFLTALVLVIILVFVLLRVNRNQQSELSKLTHEPPAIAGRDRFVTHFGLWWRVFPDDEYIEDFPYCACCEPTAKLVQTEWHPDEIYNCSRTGTTYKIYDGVPRERREVLELLYQIYFYSLPDQLHQWFRSEHTRLKALYPDASELELTTKLFDKEPFSRIPQSDRGMIIEQNPSPMAAFLFLERHFRTYRKYIRPSDVEVEAESP